METTADLVSEVARRLEAPIGPDLTAELMEREAAIQSAVFGMDEQAAREALGARLSERLDAPPALDASVGLRDARIRDLMQIVAERDGEISELERRAADAEAALTELERRAADAEAALTEQSETVEELSAQLKAVEASSSWKLTTPCGVCAALASAPEARTRVKPLRRMPLTVVACLSSSGSRPQ